MAYSIRKYQLKDGARFEVRYRKPDGASTSKRGFKRKMDADTWAAANITTAQALGGFIDPQAGNATVGELWEPWIAKKHVALAESSVKVLEDAWRAHVGPKWGARAVSSIKRSEVQDWVARMGDGSANRDGKPRGAVTVIRACDLLAGILDDAVMDKRINVNPARQGIVKPRRTRKRHVYLTARQLVALAGECRWRRDIVLTLGMTGMRWGELVGLVVGDVDLARHRIMVARNVTDIEGRMVVGDTKGHERRSIVYPTLLDDVMRSHCDGRNVDAVLFESPDRPGEWLRNTSTASADDGWLGSARTRAGIVEHMTVHDLRHTAASLMVQSGANVKTVQRQLGHKSAAMTLDVYADLFDTDLDELSEAMSDLMARENVGKMWAERRSMAA